MFTSRYGLQLTPLASNAYCSHAANPAQERVVVDPRVIDPTPSLNLPSDSHCRRGCTLDMRVSPQWSATARPASTAPANALPSVEPFYVVARIRAHGQCATHHNRIRVPAACADVRPAAAADVRIDMPRTDTHVLLREREAVHVTHRAREAEEEAVVILVASVKKQLRTLSCWPLERSPSAQNRDSSAHRLDSHFSTPTPKALRVIGPQLLVPHSSVSHCDQRTLMTHSSSRSPTTPPPEHV